MDRYSIHVSRTSADQLNAFHNVSSHRARQVIDTPPGTNGVCGHRKLFVCGFHAWRYDIDGNCTYQHDDFDWKGALTDERTHLTPVQVDTWGGWVFINMDQIGRASGRERVCQEV